MRLQRQLAVSKRHQEVNSADRPAFSPLHLQSWDATSGADLPTPSHDTSLSVLCTPSSKRPLGAVPRADVTWARRCEPPTPIYIYRCQMKHPGLRRTVNWANQFWATLELTPAHAPASPASSAFHACTVAGRDNWDAGRAARLKIPAGNLHAVTALQLQADLSPASCADHQRPDPRATPRRLHTS